MSNVNDLLPLTPPRGLPPALLALFVQIAAWLPALALVWSGIPLPASVLLQGILAMLLARMLGMPGWWRIIGLIFSPLAWLIAGSGVDPKWFLAAFLFLAATSIGSLWSRVPLYLSSQHAIEAIASHLPEHPGARVIDLGCGLGSLLAGLSERRPDIELDGVEMAPLNWFVSRLRLGRRAHIRLGSLWQMDLGQYDVVYAYLSPAAMARLWQKVQREMRPGSLFISNSFPVPGAEPDETIELHDMNRSRLLLWRR